MIVITGYRGYIGSALYACLRREGYDVQGFDIQDGPKGDITREEVRIKISGLRPTVIFNLAGVSGEAACKADLLYAFRVNANMPWQLANLCPDSVFIQASSASVVGKLDQKRTPYAFEKALAEQDLLPLSMTQPIFVLRFGTVLGYNRDGLTRWETPANKMAYDSVHSHKIVVCGPKLMRPWISLDALVHHLTTYAANPPRKGWDGPIPVAQINMSLEAMAKFIAERGRDVVTEINPPGEDARDYKIPALFGGDISWATKDLIQNA